MFFPFSMLENWQQIESGPSYLQYVRFYLIWHSSRKIIYSFAVAFAIKSPLLSLLADIFVHVKRNIPCMHLCVKCLKDRVEQNRDLEVQWHLCFYLQVGKQNNVYQLVKKLASVANFREDDGREPSLFTL